MIVTGFTQRKSNKDSIEEAIAAGQHSHCIRCHLVSCSKYVDNATSCMMVVCKLCGWRCHGCKLSEHTVTCPEERVACLNKEYGCPHMLKRSKMSVHLSVCPASVVFCAEEWSRWPMHAREQGMRMPLPREKSYLGCGQLDVGFAMRDQRMLIDSLRAPRKLRQTLRNCLTQKYPAAPFPQWSASFDSDPAASEDTSQTVSDDDADAPWDLAKPHPGLKESIRSRLFRVTKETADSLVAALEMTSDALSSSQCLPLEVSETRGSTATEMNGETETSLSDPLQRPLSPVESNKSAEKTFNIHGKELSSEAVVNKTVELTTSGVDGNFKQSDVTDHPVRSSVSSDRFSDSNSRSKSTLHDIGGTQLHKLLGYQPKEGMEDDICLHKMLGVSISIECINKYVTKASSMYTFICAQNFRRDEYPWHFKNVHMEIHTGFCGWLEQRCPLANLGCTFSFQRMEPTQPDTVIYHSWLQESFGLRNTAQPVSAPCDNTVTNFKDALDIAVSPSVKPNSEIELGRAVEGNCSQWEFHHQYENSTITESLVHAQPSITDLVKYDRDFNMHVAESQTKSNYCDNFNLNTIDRDICAGNQQSDKSQDGSSVEASDRRNISRSQEQDVRSKTVDFMRVEPTVYTASNWDSKVLFQYDMEAEGDGELTGGRINVYHSFTNLPFEVLRQIARQLDSFSLCNLALTCHLLRDVCCSLLDDRGIVILNWRKQISETNGRITWKVAGQRWMFSTSFEPIKSWRFVSGRPTIGDHLKVCPYNKDIVRHTKPVNLLISLAGQKDFSEEESPKTVLFSYG